MKRLLTLIIMVAAMCSCAPAQQKVDWKTMQQASATKGSKLYLVDFYTSWCGWCKKMDADTYTDATVTKIIDRYYMPVKFDAESTDALTWNGRTFEGSPAVNGRRQPHQFVYATLGQKIGYPTIAIFDADKALLTVVPGYMKPDDMTKILWYFASGLCRKYSWEQYESRYTSEVLPAMKKDLGLKK